MDDLEFRKHAVIDPYDQLHEFLKKTSQNIHNHQFVEEQKLFNQKLVSILEISTPENLADRIILAQQLSQHKVVQSNKRQKQWRNWLGSSIAAALILAFSLSLTLPKTQDSALLTQEVLQHVHDDTHALNIRMNVPKTNIDTMLASYGGKLNGPIGQVTFLGHCIIGGHTGVHMVLNTSKGVVTVILLPSQTIDGPTSLQDNQLKGLVYPAQKGSIAVVSEYLEAIESTRQQIDKNLNWII